MSWPFFLRKFSWHRPNGRLRIAAHLHIFRARGCPRVRGVRCGSRTPGKCTSAPLCEASVRADAGGGKASAGGGGRRGCAALTRLGWGRERPVRGRGVAKGALLLRLGALLRGDVVAGRALLARLGLRDYCVICQRTLSANSRARSSWRASSREKARCMALRPRLSGSRVR